MAQNWDWEGRGRIYSNGKEKTRIRSTIGVEEKHVSTGERVLQHSFSDHALYTTVSNFRGWFRRIGVN